MASEQPHSHSHDDPSHSHGGSADHGHSHEILDGPGSYLGREMPIIEGRDWKERAFTVGIGGYVLSSSPCSPPRSPLPQSRPTRPAKASKLGGCCLQEQ